jgi:hypothetical protein
MTTPAEYRQALADAVTGAGLTCEPYPADNPSLPSAFIDQLIVDYSSGSAASYCNSGQATATVVTAAQRNDRAGSTALLEDLVPAVLGAFDGMAGLQVASWQSGSINLAGNEVPGLVYTVRFPVQ